MGGRTSKKIKVRLHRVMRMRSRIRAVSTCEERPADDLPVYTFRSPSPHQQTRQIPHDSAGSRWIGHSHRSISSPVSRWDIHHEGRIDCRSDPAASTASKPMTERGRFYKHKRTEIDADD